MLRCACDFGDPIRPCFMGFKELYPIVPQNSFRDGIRRLVIIELGREHEEKSLSELSFSAEC